MATKKKATKSRAKALKTRRKALRLSEFRTDERYVSRRLAVLLDWVARTYPKQVLSYEEAAFAVFGLGSVPSMTSPQVKGVKSAIGSARKYLQNNMTRDIITIRGVGLRATSDSADTLQTSVARAAITHARTGEKLKTAVSLVSNTEMRQLISEAPDDLRDELEITHKWFTEGLAKYVKRIDSDKVRALLPPAR